MKCSWVRSGIRGGASWPISVGGQPIDVNGVYYDVAFVGRHRAPYAKCRRQPVAGVAQWTAGVGDDGGTKKLITSACPTNGEWFERFMLGYHRRVGDVNRPDLAISIEVMVALMARFERLWILADGDGPSQGTVLFPALFAISTYTGGLWGEETPLMDLHATAKLYQEGLITPNILTWSWRCGVVSRTRLVSLNT